VIVAAGDIHLKPLIWKGRRLIVDDTFVAFRCFVDFAIKREASSILLCGDIFDPPDSRSINEYQIAMAKYKGEVYGIDGNPHHDQSDPPWLAIPEIRGEYIHKKKVTIDGKTFYGLRNMSREVLQEELAQVPPVDFLVMHQLAKSLRGVIHSWNLDESWIPSHVKTVISGDWHKADTFPIPSGGLGYYTGSMVPLKKPELSNPHGFLVIEGDTVTYWTIPGRRFFVADCTTEAELLKKLGKIGRKLKKAQAIDLVLTPAVFVSYHIDIINAQKILTDFEEAYSIIVDASPSVVEGDQPLVVNEAVPIDHLVSRFTHTKEAEQLTLRLLQVCKRSTIDNFRATFSKDSPLS